MIYITEQEQFVGELSLILSQKCDEDPRLKYFIESYEPEILRDLLSDDFYNELQIQLDDPLTGDWTTLVNGGDFVYCGKSHHFKGLKYMTARYIYFYYQRDNATVTSSNAENQPKQENSLNMGNMVKQRTNWNKAFNQVEVLKKFLSSTDFENYKVKPHAGGRLLEW